MDIYEYNNRLVTISGKFLSPVVEPPGPTDEVQIGNQIWKTKNLAIDDGQGGIYTKTVNYGQGDVVEYYYTWDAAVRVAASVNGWHLPDVGDWYTLIDVVSGDGNKLKTTYGWNDDGNGTDDYSFAVFPAGYMWSNGNFYGLGTKIYFWTADQISESYATTYSFETSSSIRRSNEDKTDRYSVRLVKDAS